MKMWVARNEGFEFCTLFISKPNKVYKLVNVAIAGNGHRLKAWIIDVYTDKEIIAVYRIWKL